MWARDVTGGIHQCRDGIRAAKGARAGRRGEGWGRPQRMSRADSEVGRAQAARGRGSGEPLQVSVGSELTVSGPQTSL